MRDAYCVLRIAYCVTCPLAPDPRPLTPHPALSPHAGRGFRAPAPWPLTPMGSIRGLAGVLGAHGRESGGVQRRGGKADDFRQGYGLLQVAHGGREVALGAVEQGEVGE